MRRRCRTGNAARALGLLVALVAPACSIQPDTAPREIPAGDRGIIDPVIPEGGEEGDGSTRVYLVAEQGESGPRLRAVQRGVDATPSAALQELFNGANDQEVEAGLGTAIPADLRLLRAPRQVTDTLQVDVSTEILDLSAPALIHAVAQIVFTASELPKVREVRLRVGGEDREWPDGRGELQRGTLTRYDYPGLAESSQPAYPPIPSATLPA